MWLSRKERSNVLPNKWLSLNTFLAMIVALISMPMWAQDSVTIGSWRVDCNKQGIAKDQCVAHQLVITERPLNQTVLGVMVSYIANHPAPHIIFRTSHKANIVKGAAIKVDKNELLQIPVSSCDENVCEVRSFIPKGLLNQMLTGQQLRFAFFIEDKQYTYPVSLSGFAETYAMLKGSSIKP